MPVNGTSKVCTCVHSFSPSFPQKKISNGKMSLCFFKLLIIEDSTMFVVRSMCG